MPHSASRILLVEDEPSIRISMTLVLVELGYTVQLAEDGHSALASIRREMPDILLTDLNMPGMSGFDLLSVVRQQFPTLRTIAMSGAYSSSDVPTGVTADAFYPKGTGHKELQEALRMLTQAEPYWPRVATPMAPFPTSQSNNDSSPEACATVACPECVQTFPLGLSDSVDHTHAMQCLHNHSTNHFAVAPSVERLPLPALHNIPAKSKPAPRSAAQHYY